VSAFTRRQFLAGASALGAGAGASALGLTACAQGSRSAVGSGPSPGANRRGEGLRQALRILLLGGTGFLGPAVVRAALERGHRPTLFHRGKTRPGLFPGVEELFGDRDGKLDALRGRQFDAVVDTSGYVPRVVRQSAQLLAAQAARYLFVSSISVYADPIAPGAAEEAPLAALTDLASEDVGRDYGALKAACERVVKEAFPRGALVVRPGLIAGPGDPTDRFTYWPARLARGGDVLAPGDGTDPTQLVDVRDLGAFFVHLLELQATGTFNATGPARATNLRELLTEVGRAVGSKARLTWVDPGFLEAHDVKPWTDLPAWVPRADGGILQVSVARALAAGLSLRPIAETARDTLGWWSAEPEERRAKPRAGLSAAREAEVLAAWNARKR
jgi:2'-hydroxyisoflavone reductase